MTADLSREMPLDELAQSVNLSPSRLRHLFKDETGTSLLQYLKTQKMLKAKELLETTFLSLKEVIHQAGFKDRSHFVKDFKKAYGLSPLQYRNQFLTAGDEELSKIANTATR